MIHWTDSKTRGRLRLSVSAGTVGREFRRESRRTWSTRASHHERRVSTGSGPRFLKRLKFLPVGYGSGWLLVCLLDLPPIVLVLLLSPVIVPCAVQDGVVSFTRLGMRKSHGARRPRPKPVKWISIARLLLLLACAAGWMATGTPAYFALYLTAWSVSHELTRKYKPRWSEGPSYVRKLWVALAEQAMRGRDTGDIPVRFHMPLWIAACAITVVLAISAPLPKTGRTTLAQYVYHSLLLGTGTPTSTTTTPTTSTTTTTTTTVPPSQNSTTTTEPPVGPTTTTTTSPSLQAECGTTNLDIAKGTPAKIETVMNAAWQALASVVGCQTNRAPILTHSLSVVWLDAPSGQSAVVGNIRLANLGSVVVHPESLAEFQSLLDSGNLTGVTLRTSTGIGDFQAFLEVGGTCRLSMRPTFAEPSSLLTDDQTVAALSVALVRRSRRWSCDDR